MLTSESLSASFLMRSRRGITSALFLLALIVAPLTSAVGQADFTLTMASFRPFAMNPGGSAQSNIALNPLNGFSSSVDLTCAVTTSQPNATLPSCVVSPAAVTPPGTATASVSSVTSTGATATAGDYTITITASGGGQTHTASQDVSVLSVTAQFTITVTSIVAPNSVPAGSGAQATISVNPISGYTGTVVLSCSSISPVVLVPPVCTFTYPPGQNGLPVSGTPTTATLTINTTGPIPNPSSADFGGKANWALWLPFPIFGFLGLGGAAKFRRLRATFAVLSIFAVAASFLLLPACGNNSSSTTSTNPNGNTPSNTYTFTISGVDQNGNVSSNTGVNNSAATVSLTVTAPAQ